MLNINNLRVKKYDEEGISLGTRSLRSYITSMGFSGHSIVQDLRYFLESKGYWVGNIPESLKGWYEDNISSGRVELLDNNSFDVGTTSWTEQGDNAIFTVSDGVATVITSNYEGIYQAIMTTTGESYTVIANTSQQVSSCMVRVCDGAIPNAGFSNNELESGSVTFDFTALSDITTIYLRNGVAGTTKWTDVSVMISE